MAPPQAGSALEPCPAPVHTHYQYIVCGQLPEKMSCLCIFLYISSAPCCQQASKVKQTNKAKQHSTPKAVTFPRKNELPRVGLEPTTLYTLDRALYQLSYRGSSAGWAQISHLMYLYVVYDPLSCHVWGHRGHPWCLGGACRQGHDPQ